MTDLRSVETYALPRVIPTVLALASACLGAPGALAQQCPETGTGDLELRVSEGAQVTAVGPDGTAHEIRGSRTLEGVPAGAYSVSAEIRRRTEPGPVVGTAYGIAIRPAGPCVRADTTVTVEVGWAREPGSRHMWIVDGGGNTVVAMRPGEAEPVFAHPGGTSPRGLAFDRAGNLWVADGAGAVISYGAFSLADTAVERRSRFVPAGFSQPHALAVDDEGGLWVTSGAGSRIGRFSPELRSGEREPEVVIENVQGSKGLAFDRAGNLWVANSSRPPMVTMFGAQRLTGTVDGGDPDIAIVAWSGPPVRSELSEPRGLAFDADGNLWVGYWGPNILARLTPADLAAGGDITPEVQITTDVLALVEALAFDERGYLWFTYTAESIAALAPGQQRESVRGILPEVIVSSDLWRYATGIAFDPPAHSAPIAR